MKQELSNNNYNKKMLCTEVDLDNSYIQFQIKMKVFTSEEELKTFITINKLPLTYKEWRP